MDLIQIITIHKTCMFSILDNHLEEIEPLEQDPNNNVPGYHYGIDGNGIKFVEMIKGEPYTPPTVYKKWRMLMDRC